MIIVLGLIARNGLRGWVAANQPAKWNCKDTLWLFIQCLYYHFKVHFAGQKLQVGLIQHLNTMAGNCCRAIENWQHPQI